MGRITAKRPIIKVRLPHGSTRRGDTLAVEEPLEIRVGGKPFTVTMRTPGNDVELAHGFLASEGVITGREDVLGAIHCGGADMGGEPNTYNVLDLTLAPHIELPELDRHFYTTSSCGVCGKASIDAVTTTSHFEAAVPDDARTISAELIVELPDILRKNQKVFDKTGGLHAAGLFGRDGELLCVREDVGRHNAVDKVIGWAVENDMLPLWDTVLQLSGRASFELVQKAHMAGIPMLSAVSAPSSLAVELAAETGMTLTGFVRGAGFNIYTGQERIALPE